LPEFQVGSSREPALLCDLCGLSFATFAKSFLSSKSQKSKDFNRKGRKEIKNRDTG
jgi:hypothetical protein